VTLKNIIIKYTVQKARFMMGYETNPYHTIQCRCLYGGRLDD